MIAMTTNNSMSVNAGFPCDLELRRPNPEPCNLRGCFMMDAKTILALEPRISTTQFDVEMSGWRLTDSAIFHASDELQCDAGVKPRRGWPVDSNAHAMKTTKPRRGDLSKELDRSRSGHPSGVPSGVHSHDCPPTRCSSTLRRAEQGSVLHQGTAETAEHAALLFCGGVKLIVGTFAQKSLA